MDLRKLLALILWEAVSLATIAAGAVFLFDAEGPVEAGLSLICAGVLLGAYPPILAYRRRRTKKEV